jgi:hypothetical protein
MPASSAPEKRPDPASAEAWSHPLLLGGLKWLVLSLGLSGLLVLVGFLISFAYQQRLGFQFGDSGSTVSYVTEAGGFFVAIFTTAADWVFDFPILAIVIGALALGLYIAWRRWPRIFFLGPLPRLGVLIVLVLGMAMEIIFFDLPTIPIDDELVRGLYVSQDFPGTGIVSAMAREIWADEVCSRIELRNRTDLAKAGTVCKLSPDGHRRRGARRFLWNILLTFSASCLTMGFLFKHIKPERIRSTDFQVNMALQVTVVLLVLVDMLFLPYSYGKTTKSSVTSEVIVTAALESEIPTPHHGFLLSAGPGDVVLFNKEEEEMQLWIIPRNRVRFTRVEGARDVLEFYFKKQLESVGSSQAPP